MNHTRQFFLKLGLTASIVVTHANAASIAFNFTGTVTGVGAQLGTTTFSNNQLVFGSYTFNSATADGIGGSTIGKYNGTNSNLVVNIESYNATLGAGSNFITVENLPTVDSYTMQAPFAGSTVNGRTPQFFAIELADPTHNCIYQRPVAHDSPGSGLFCNKELPPGF
jgi:hypothetical protein